MDKVGIYARVSTMDRGQDVDNQLNQLKEYCRNKGYEIFNIYSDQITGTGRKKRPEFERMINDAKQRKFNILLVWAYDRFSRAGLTDIQIILDIHSRGVKFVSYTEPFLDMSSPTGELMLPFMAWISKQESRRMSERVKAGLIRARAEGKRLGRRETTLDGQKIIALREQGIGWRTIAKEIGAKNHVVVINHYKKIMAKTRENKESVNHSSV